MGVEELGPWSPLALGETVDLFSRYRGRWWIAGGQALDLFVGNTWRDHEDTDVGFLRHDAGFIRQVLSKWDVQVAAAGQLSPWDGHEPNPELDENNLWCRPAPPSAWCIDLTISEGDSECWIYRRDPTVRVPWGEAILRSPSDMPYLAPELQLLYKSKQLRHKDDVDARQVIPDLGDSRRAWLTSHLPRNHPWLALLT